MAHTSPSAYAPAAGLETTFQLLAHTNNEAATATLVPALESTRADIQLAALDAILDRRSLAGQTEVLKRLHQGTPRWRDIIASKQGRLTRALRDGLLGADPQVRTNACQAILWFREYDLAGVLITALEDSANPQAELAAQTLLALVDGLYEELSSAPRDYVDRRDPQLIRHRLAGTLEPSVRRFAQHGRGEVLGAFLLLAQRDNVTLKQILQDPHHPTFAALVGAMSHDARPGVIGLVLSFLDDPHAPSAAIAVLARRSDPRFILALLRKASHLLTAPATANFKRIESLSWLKIAPKALDQLDESHQVGLVHLAMVSGIRRGDVFRLVEHLVNHGRPAARVAAAKALAQFDTPAAAALVLAALQDPDPRVQAAVLPQIRQRGTPGALARLIELVDSPHECVRQAARESLTEFTFDRYLAAFDMLEEDARQATGQLVLKIDAEALAALEEEMRAQSRSRRQRAIAIAAAMAVIPQLERRLIGMLGDEDHLVRGDAARALAQCDSRQSRAALRGALADRAVSVQDAAEQSLLHLDGGGAGKEPS